MARRSLPTKNRSFPASATDKRPDATCIIAHVARSLLVTPASCAVHCLFAAPTPISHLMAALRPLPLHQFRISMLISTALVGLTARPMRPKTPLQFPSPSTCRLVSWKSAPYPRRRPGLVLDSSSSRSWSRSRYGVHEPRVHVLSLLSTEFNKVLYLDGPLPRFSCLEGIWRDTILLFCGNNFGPFLNHEASALDSGERDYSLR